MQLLPAWLVAGSIMSLAIASGGCRKIDIEANCLNPLAKCFKNDKTAPSVQSSQAVPATGTTTVSVLTAIQVTFSEELKDATNAANYKLVNAGTLQIASVDKTGSNSVQVNLTGQVANGQIILTFPGLTDYGGNALVAGSNVTLLGNVNIGIVFEDASSTYYVNSDPTPTGGTAITQAVIHWHHDYEKDSNNTYVVKLGGSTCSDATAATGTNVSGSSLVYNTSVTTTITVASSFATAGTYLVRICVDNTGRNKSGEGVATVISDNAEPVVVTDNSGGNYSSPPPVNFSCTDNCSSVAYTLASGNTLPAAPAAPVFNASGAVTSGTLVSGAWNIVPGSYPWYTVIKLVAFDKSGNQSLPVTYTFLVDPSIPNVTFGSPASTHDYVSSGGFTSTTINWLADKAGSYVICRGGTGCSTTPGCTGGTAIGAVTGYPTANAPIATVISNASLAAGTNTLHICVANLTNTQVGDATRTVTLDNTAPTIASTSPADNANGVLPTGAIIINFTEIVGLDTSTITTNAGDNSCSGSIQVSLASDNFATNKCVRMAAAPTQVSGTTYRVIPYGRLNPGQYKLRVTSAVKDLAGNALTAFTQATGFTVTGLLRQFTFNNDSTDLTDQAQSGFDLTAVGGPTKTTGVDGDLNGAYKFSGPGSAYLTGLDSLLPNGNAPRTFCTWAMASNQCSGICMASMYGTTSHGSYIGFWNGRGVYGAFGGLDYQGTTALPINTWVHLCSVYDGSAVTVYVNGVQNGATASAWNTVLGGGLTVGRQSGGAGYAMNGKVDDVRVYAGALAAAEIRQMAVQVPNGLQVYYSFSDAASLTAVDYSSNGHNGSLAGSPAATADRFAVPGAAYNFNAATKYISASDTGLPTGNSPRTMCSWVRPATLPASGSYAIAAKYGSPSTSAANYIGLFNNGGTMNAIYSGWGDHLNIAYTFAVNTWYHICGSYDGTNAKLYVNGELIGFLAKNWNTALLGNNGVVVGRGDMTTSYPFTGDIDDVRIYNRVLTDNELLALSGQLGVGLIRQYSFTAGALTDDAGSGLSLTAVGAPASTTGALGDANGAFSFSGTQYFSASDSGLPAGAAARTMCAWIYPTIAPENSFAISYGTVNSGQNSFLYVDGANTAGFGSYGANLQSTYNPPLNTWTHLCGVYDSAGFASLYAGGTIVPGGSATALAFTTLLSGSLRIGARSDNQYMWTGNLDGIRIYNRALGKNEILELQGY